MIMFPDWVAGHLATSHRSPLDGIVVMFEDTKVSVIEYLYVCRRCQVMRLLHFEVRVCLWFLSFIGLHHAVHAAIVRFLAGADRVF